MANEQLKKGGDMHHETLFIMLADKIKFNCRAKLEFGKGCEEEWFTDKSVEFTLGCLWS